jgi:hypothetical protein
LKHSSYTAMIGKTDRIPVSWNLCSSERNRQLSGKTSGREKSCNELIGVLWCRILGANSDC